MAIGIDIYNNTFGRGNQRTLYIARHLYEIIRNDNYQFLTGISPSNTGVVQKLQISHYLKGEEAPSLPYFTWDTPNSLLFNVSVLSNSIESEINQQILFSTVTHHMRHLHPDPHFVHYNLKSLYSLSMMTICALEVI